MKCERHDSLFFQGLGAGIAEQLLLGEIDLIALWRDDIGNAKDRFLVMAGEGAAGIKDQMGAVNQGLDGVCPGKVWDALVA